MSTAQSRLSPSACLHTPPLSPALIHSRHHCEFSGCPQLLNPLLLLPSPPCSLTTSWHLTAKLQLSQRLKAEELWPSPLRAMTMHSMPGPASLQVTHGLADTGECLWQTLEIADPNHLSSVSLSTPALVQAGQVPDAISRPVTHQRT